MNGTLTNWLENRGEALGMGILVSRYYGNGNDGMEMWLRIS
jgi:hypothetical protein